MSRHRHNFVETYDGLVGYGYDRQCNENTLACYLQKFSDDEHVKLMLSRMSDEDMDKLFNLLGELLKKYLEEPEYHSVFLKDEE
jgi:hypothetical protein